MKANKKGKVAAETKVQVDIVLNILPGDLSNQESDEYKKDTIPKPCPEGQVSRDVLGVFKES